MALNQAHIKQEEEKSRMQISLCLIGPNINKTVHCFQAPL
jgi:hypothetical protein